MKAAPASGEACWNSSSTGIRRTVNGNVWQRAAPAAVAGEMPLNGKAFASGCVEAQSGEQSSSVESPLHPYVCLMSSVSVSPI